MRELTNQEKAVLHLLGQAWNELLMLPEIHPADRDEFLRAIHAAQNIILARPAEETSAIAYCGLEQLRGK